MLVNDRMKKLQHIFFFYLFFAILVVFVVHSTKLGFLGGFISSGTADYYLYEFDQRLERFRQAQSPRTVIVGTCYAAFLGESNDTYNLGLATGNFDEEYKITQKYVSPSDRVLYVFGLPDLLKSQTTATRFATHNDYFRRLFLMRSALSSFLGINPPPVERVVPTLKQTDSLKKACGLEDIPAPASFMASIDAFSGPEASPTLENLSAFRAMHENTVFLYHPPLQITAIEGTDELAQKLQRVAHLESEVEQMLKGASLPYTDMSAAIERSDYMDLLHLKRQSVFRLSGALPALLKNEYHFVSEEKRVPPYTYGAKITFGRTGNYSEYEGPGWSEPEADFTWTNGRSASLIIPTDGTKSDLELRVILLPFTAAGKIESQRVDVLVNDQLVRQWVVARQQLGVWERFLSKIDRTRRFQVQTAPVPASLLSDSTVKVTFCLPDAAIPSKLGVSPDERTLGIAVRSVVLDRTDNKDRLAEVRNP